MISILKPGMLTTVQDLGRFGFQKNGMIAGGAMDPFAHRIANILVGNDENESTLEITLLGPTVTFHQDTLISICGGDLSPMIDGEHVKLWRPVFVKKGATLQFGHNQKGFRSYLAIAGGLQIPSVMNSKSTYLRAGIGGFQGRALKAGDKISLGSLNQKSKRIFSAFSKRNHNSKMSAASWTITAELIPHYSDFPMVRAIKGRQFNYFNKYSQTKFFKEPFIVTPHSDRMGYRLNGPTLTLRNDEEMISEAVSFGTIQVPADGRPIILLADRQTTGGYPKIAQIASVDLPLIAQTKPGDFISFSKITQGEAQVLLLDQEKKIQELKQGVALKYS